MPCLLHVSSTTGLSSQSSTDDKWRDAGAGLAEGGEHWSLTTLREKLIKIGAKVVRHGRSVTFQLAEVAIPRWLFAAILQLIDGLRPRPAPT